MYSKTKYSVLQDEFLKDTPEDFSNAASQITSLALSKFRRGNTNKILIQGQFGELILFNFLQHFFNAVPLLRKQPITTSVGHERFGADAIHLKSDGQNHELFLGESKVYYAGGFSSAFEAALSSIVTTYQKLREELDLYVYDDFIDENLRDFAKKYKRNEINCPIQLVCFVAYNSTKVIDKQNPDKIRTQIIDVIKESCSRLKADIFASLPSYLMPKMNYIIFPIWELETLLADFERRIG